MAPTTTSHFPPAEYYQNLSSDYVIPQTIFDQPSNRKVRIINLGAGLNSINAAYHMQKHCSNFELAIYEKLPTIGGTWALNQYPNVGCDVPSHIYEFTWAPNPDWSRFYSYGAEILKYFEKTCEVFGLYKYKAVHAQWMEEEGLWKVKLRETSSDGSIREFEDHCDILLNNCGIQNNWKWPDVEGLDIFKGKLLHTARWDQDFQAPQWKGKKVAMIGSGASSVQVVPAMQPHIDHMDIFVRTGIWFVGLGSSSGGNKEYSAEDKNRMRDVNVLIAHSKGIERDLNAIFPAFYKNTDAQNKFQDIFRERTAKLIKDERLLQGFTPNFQLGCRRVTPGDPYIEAIQNPNVDVHFTGVKHLTEKGVVGVDGIEREADVVVCATGFDVCYKPDFPIIGRNGIDLRDQWATEPDSYMGISCPNMPNFYFSCGSYWPVANGCLIGASNACSMYIVQVIKKMQLQPNIRSLCAKQRATDQFVEHCQQWYKHMCWSEHCPSWYKNPKTGRIRSIWPGITLHHTRALRTPRWEDFDYTYKKNPATGIEDNMFSYLGMGWVPEMFDTTLDDSPHIQKENIDPVWAKSKRIRVGNEEVQLVGGDGGLNGGQRELKTLEGEKGWVKEVENGASHEHVMVL